MIRFISRLSSAKLEGVALLRLDFNTADEWRLAASIPTVKFLAARAEKVIIVSHRGRPKGISLKKLSLRKDADLLRKYLKRPVIFIPHFRWSDIALSIARAPRGSVILLENIRFVRGEEENSLMVARALASLADYYVNDAFAVSHRPAASIVGVTRLLPSYGGLGLEKEIQSLSSVLKNPRKPLVLVIGGAKAHDKLGVISNFKNKVAFILVGGGSANTLLYLRGIDIGNSLFDSDVKDLTILKKVLKFPSLILPLDWKTEQKRILDIGPLTEELFAAQIARAGTIVWSGPMGLIEKKKFEHGNLTIARAITANKKAFSLTGGGETVTFLKKHKLDKKFSFISTGGGAFLEFLAGKKLPGIEALQSSKK